MVGEKYFYNNYSIAKDELHIIITTYGESIVYGSRFRAICQGNNTYIDPGRVVVVY